MIATYDARRKYMVDRLRKMGLDVPADPAGAFYVMADAHPFTDDSLSFVSAILEKTGVACTPGIDFGAEGFIRFSYANNLENIAEAMDRLEKYMRGLCV